MMLSHSLLLLVYLALFTKTNPAYGVNENIGILQASLPVFTWIDQLRIEVKFPDGAQDRIVLWPSKNIAVMNVSCLYDGTMEVETSADVVVSGCKDDPLVSITIHSNRLIGRTMFNIRDKATEEIHNPYANGELLKEVYDYKDEADQRIKRSIFEDYIMEDYDDLEYDGHVDPPPRLKMNIKLGFEESLKTHLGGETAAREYVVRVFAHGRSYMRHNSLGTSLELHLVEPPVYIPNQHWKARRASMTEAKKFKVNETIPAIFFCFDGDDDTFLGVSKIRSACDPTQGVGIVKFRENVQVAANTLSHEHGHLVGLQHDMEEDKRGDGNKDDPCHGNGLMSEVAPSERPAQFTVCNQKRFKLWYNNYGTCLTEVKIPENLKRCPYPPSSWIAPCQCKINSNAPYNTYLFCDMISQKIINNLLRVNKCNKIAIHRLEINMNGNELDLSFGLENIGQLQIDYIHLFNMSRITADFEANAFKGSSQTLKEIKIQRLPGMESAGRTVRSEAFSKLVALETIHIGHDFKTLQSKSFSGLPSVINIKIEGVKTIESNAFYDMESLKKLDLANNKITDLGSNIVEKLPKLAIIDLSSNNISSLPRNLFENLPSLTNIYLDNNKIASIHNNAMTNLPKLMFLNLSNNPIKEMGTTLDNIKNKDLIINISETKIEFLMAHTFKPFVDNIMKQGGMGSIGLKGSPLDCGCDTKWLFNKQHDSGITKFHNAVCQDGNTLEEVDAKMLNDLCPIRFEFCPGIPGRSGCQDGWSQFRSSCYKMFILKKSWSSASAHCKSLKAELASIHSEEENQFLINLAKGQNANGYVWIGGTYDREWSDGRTWDYENWRSGQPNSKDRVALRMQPDDYFGQWQDLSDSIEYIFICKM